MKLDFLNQLSCTHCKSGPLRCARGEGLDRDAVSTGEIRCDSCGAEFPIRDGIVMFDITNTETLREMSQWERFAESEGWLEKNEGYLESLPSAGSNVLMKGDTIGWLYHEYEFFSMVTSLNLTNKRILDLGAGRCWSSKWMSLMGGVVVAFDAMSHPTVGLGAGGVYMKNHEIYFERVQGDFNALPFKDAQFDIVISTGAIHHSTDIRQTIREVSRVLRPGGLAVLVNEMASGFYVIKEKHNMTGHQHGINEVSYRMTKLLSSFRASNLKIVDLRGSIRVYDKRTPYYQGIFGSLINAATWSKLANLVIRGGLYSCVLRRNV